MKFRNVGIHSKLSSIMLNYSVVEKSTRLNSKLPGAVFPAQRVVFPFCFAPLANKCSNFKKKSM